MSRPRTIALLGALALGAASLIAEPAAALPVSGLAPAATEANLAGPVEQVRYYRRGFVRRGYGFRRPGYAYRGGYGYRRRGPIRRFLRRL